MRRWTTGVLGMLILGLAGCLTGGRRGGDQAMTLYDLGPPPAAAAPARALAVEVRAPAWLDSPALVYRLAYGDAAQWREYSQSRWLAPPAGLIERRLQHLLGYGGALRAGCLLRLELDEFSQVFSQPDRSQGLLQARATWFDPARRSLQARSLRIEVPAAAPEARAGVAALTQAVSRLAEAMAAEEGALPAACR